ncbi:MAG: dienelactone hydrolase family protein [Jiangellaceae bacterium]|nr:dienelactone hydrolase family protein [Jiangellaceae bacterium]
MEREVTIEAAGRQLPGTLRSPDQAHGIVVFAHGSGSSRHSRRNVYVSQVLHAAGFATLLFDLLTADEERRDAADASLRFDIALLSGRLDAAVQAVAADASPAGRPIGLFGASTGAAAALQTAARLTDVVASVVSRGGRPDLAGDALERVRAPVLLIIGERDRQVLQLNAQAARRMRCPHELSVVPGATHLFEERGALEEVARLAADWFAKTLPTTGGPPTP